MAADYELTLNDYLQILHRRKFHIFGIFSALAIITIIVTLVIPPVYEATGTILIESQEVPTDLIQASITTFADERIEIIKQRVMTRENLSRIIEKYKLYKDDVRNLTPSEVIDEARSNIGIELVKADVKGKGGGSKATIAFMVSFDDKSPQVAYKVSNDLVTLFLDENVKSRTERASETTTFLTQESERLKAELEKIENEVASYKQQHANALPEHTELRMTMVQRAESELKDLDREYKDTQERLSYLDVELASAKAGIGNRMSPNVAPSPASELEKLQAEYAKLSAIYKEGHPDLRALKRKIEALQKSSSETPATDEKKAPTENIATDLMVAKVQAQIDAGNARLVSIDQQRKGLRGKLGQLENEIVQSPQVEHGLSSLLRDYDTAKRKYEEVLAKQGSAKISQNLEQENKGEKFSLIDPPQLPDKPIKPNRIKILLVGLVLSIGAAGGGIFMLEMAGNRIWGVEALAVAIRQHPLAVIPYITTQDEISQKNRKLRMILIAVVLSLIISAVLVHFFYMPLDMLMYKITARFA